MSRFACGRINALPAYEPNPAIFDCKLDANENPYPPDSDLRALIAAALADAPLNRYPDPLAHEVRRAYADVMGLDMACVVPGNGLDELISLLMSAFLEPQECLLTFSPDFSMYAFYAGVRGCRVVEKAKPGYRLDADLLIRSARDCGAKMVIFSNPCNPTGGLLPQRELARALGELDCLVVADEAYMDFAGESALPLVGQYDNLIVLRTCSKAFSLAGLRLGFAVAAPELAAVLMKVKSPYNLNVLTQLAAVPCIRAEQKRRENLREISRTRDWFYRELCALEADGLTVYPSAANFIYLETDGAPALDTQLQRAGIIVRRFGARGLRITIGRPDEMRAVVQIIKTGLEQMS